MLTYVKLNKFHENIATRLHNAGADDDILALNKAVERIHSGQVKQSSEKQVVMNVDEKSSNKPKGTKDKSNMVCYE